ncbi:MAG TPA: M13-type metalloendopeptidase [Polyangiaceae bacterium]
MRNPTLRVLAVLAVLPSCQATAPQTPPPAAAAAPTTPAVAAPSGPKPELGNFGIELQNGDASVKPGNDFYRSVNGRWLSTYQLKPDEMRYGAFVKLQYRSEDQVKAIVDEISSRPNAPGSIEQKIADYFKSYLDKAALNAKGIAPLKGELDRIAAIKDQKGLVEAFGRAELAETNSPIGAGVDVDRRNPDRYLLNVGQSGLGLPDRSFYLEDSFKQIVTAYEAHIATMLGFTGMKEADAKAAASAVVKLETEIAKIHWPRTELRNVDKTNNVYTLKKLETEVAGYPWRSHFKGAGIDPKVLAELNVLTPSALSPLAKLVSQTPLATWKTYLTYHAVRGHAPLLGDAIDNANFAFFGKVLAGQQEQRERWKRGINLVGAMDSLGEALGKLYVERHYPPESEAQMASLVANLRAALKERIETLPWMGPETKREALEKLGTFNPKIGHPKKWRDFSGIGIVPGDLFANYRSVKQYWYDDEIARLGKPTDKDEWFMTPQTINAYYNPSFNEIVFPAAILQPPFFDPRADAAVNYGAIGAVIGHEMGHGFDDQGSKSDARGVQRNWWTDADRARFEARTKSLVTQFSAFEPLKGHKINGELTLGENIGDLGGLSMAYHAYKKSLNGKPAPVIDGFTGEQRFFLAWAQVWQAKYRDEYLLMTLKSDPHSPPEFRVNGVVRNMDAWHEAFGVKPGDALFLAPDQRVSIW